MSSTWKLKYDKLLKFNFIFKETELRSSLKNKINIAHTSFMPKMLKKFKFTRPTNVQ
jgi:hypothetical protein